MPTATNKPRGPYAKTASVRARIVEACGAVLAETGFHGLTMKDVAVRAGISPRGLVHHFTNKDELLAAVLEAIEERESVDAPPPGDPRGVRGIVDGALSQRRSPGVVDLTLTLTAAASSAEHPAHVYFTRRYSDLRAYLTLAFQALGEEGRLASTADPAVLAGMLIALFDGLNMQWLYHPDAIDVPAALDVFFDLIGADLEPSEGSVTPAD